MYFLTFLLTFLMTALASTASPILKRELGGVLICTGVNATGSCEYVDSTMGQCTDLAAPYLKNAATFAPSGEEFYCYPYLYACDGICESPEGCTYGPVSFNTTIKMDFTEGGWNNLIESFTCYPGAEQQVY